MQETVDSLRDGDGFAGPVDPARAAVYAPPVLSHAPRLLSTLDRDPASADYGGFDRDHWAWKYRDFPVTMLQLGVQPLARLWRYPLPDSDYHRDPALLEWILGSLRAVCRRQHDDGSFDSVAPNARDQGVSLLMALALCRCLELLGVAVPRELARRMRDAVERACRYAMGSSEDYAFIGNHHALFALAYLEAADLLEVEVFRVAARREVRELLGRQSKDGWFEEYGGPDPGYESFTVAYLSAYWQRTREPELLAALERCVAFYAYCVHPDGSVGGVYGSRQTSLYNPAGFERLASSIPLAASVAGFMRDALGKHNVLTPASADPENLAFVLDAYLDACLGEARAPVDAPALPFETLQGLRRFDDCGLAFYGTRSYYGVVHGGKGGVCCLFDRPSRRKAYQDAGYLVRGRGRVWSSNHPGSTSRGEEQGLCVEAVLRDAGQPRLTPGRFVLLRLLNLTLFRSARLARWIRRRIVNRLILDRGRSPLRLERRVRFEPDRVHFHDRLAGPPGLGLDELRASTCHTPRHMGSANYYHPADLGPRLSPPTSGLVRSLSAEGRVESRFAVRFDETGEVSLEASRGGEGRGLG